MRIEPPEKALWKIPASEKERMKEKNGEKRHASVIF